MFSRYVKVCSTDIVKLSDGPSLISFKGSLLIRIGGDPDLSSGVFHEFSDLCLDYTLNEPLYAKLTLLPTSSNSDIRVTVTQY